MGITLFSKSLIEKSLKYKPDIKSVIELGSQNDYTTGEQKPPFANELYKRLGVSDYDCIDLAGDNNAFKQDLSRLFKQDGGFQYDLVTDFGTSEHVVLADGYITTPFHDGYINSVYPKVVESVLQGYYNCWLNKHNLLKIGGIMINENPRRDNWPGHGYVYLGPKFYDELAECVDYIFIDDGVHAAMGNTENGYNVWAIMQKQSERFPTFEEFIELPIFSE